MVITAAPGGLLARRRRSWPRTLGILLLLAVLLFVGGRLLSTYEKYGEFWWGPTATPPKIQYQGNEYDRGFVEVGFARVQKLPAGLGLVRKGRFAGGSTIFAGSATPAQPSPVVYLLSGRTFVGYGCRCGGD